MSFNFGIWVVKRICLKLITHKPVTRCIFKTFICHKGGFIYEENNVRK